MRLLVGVVVMVALWLVSGAAVAAGSGVPFGGGPVLTSFQPETYGSREAAAALVQATAGGASSVGIIVTWYELSTSSGDVHRDLRRTPRDDAVRAIITHAHALGLTVMLSPRVDLAGGGWRGNIRPSRPDDWFASYEAMIGHYARLAESADVELFSVGSEMRSLSRDAARWAHLVRAVRARYDGAVTYAANWDEYAR